jgi:hypothetical protein
MFLVLVNAFKNNMGRVDIAISKTPDISFLGLRVNWTNPQAFAETPSAVGFWRSRGKRKLTKTGIPQRNKLLPQKRGISN